jgi:hypothetical protein
MTEPQPRRYSDEEVRLLLERAADLQHASPPGHDAAGLTLPELEEVASEAGLDVTLLRRAAAELDRSRPPAGRSVGAALAGAPVRVILERTLPFEADGDTLAGLTGALHDAADAPGHASLVGRTLTWHAGRTGGARTLDVRVSVQDGLTVVRIEERYAGLAGALFGGLLGGVGGAGIGVGGTLGGVLGSVPLAIAAPFAIFGAAYATARMLYRRVVRRRHAVLASLMETVVDTLSQPQR